MDGTQVVGLGGKCLSPLSRLTGPCVGCLIQIEDVPSVKSLKVFPNPKHPAYDTFFVQVLWMKGRVVSSLSGRDFCARSGVAETVAVLRYRLEIMRVVPLSVHSAMVFLVQGHTAILPHFLLIVCHSRSSVLLFP